MRTISLTQGQSAILDDEDFERVNEFKWYAHWQPTSKSFYAKRKVKLGVNKWGMLAMHNFILGTPEGMRGDHLNGDTLDNTRKNLRIATHAQNMANCKAKSHNKSGYKGVTRVKKNTLTPTWQANIRVNGKDVYLGQARTPEGAYALYQAGYRVHYGEFYRD